MIFACLDVSLGWIWSPLAKAVSEPTEAVPSIFGVVVDAAAPSGTSAVVMNPLSFVRSDVFVGVVIAAVFEVMVAAVPLTVMLSMTLTCAPEAMPESLFFSVVV